MFKIWNATNFRRSVAGVCLVFAPILFAAAELLGPDTSGGASSQLAQFAEHRDALLATVLLGIGSAMLFIPALFGLLQQIRARGVVYGHLSAFFVIYALIATTALSGINLVFWEMAKPGQNHAAMVTLLNGLQHESVGLFLLIGHYLLAIGFVLLGIAVGRAKLAPRWAWILVILFPVVDVVAGFTPLDGIVSDVLSDACGVVGFAALGIRMLMERDAAWERGSVTIASTAGVGSAA